MGKQSTKTRTHKKEACEHMNRHVKKAATSSGSLVIHYFLGVFLIPTLHYIGNSLERN